MSMPYAGDETFLSDEKIRELAAQFGTPFYLYDETRIRQRAAEVSRAFAWNPGFAEWFPAAASPNPSIRKLLRQCGCRTAVSSVYDLEIAHRCGYGAEEVLYHVVYPRQEEIPQILRRKPLLVFNDPTDAVAFAAQGPLESGVCLRLNPGGHYMPGFQSVGRSAKSKLGMSREEILHLLPVLRQAGVTQIGLCASFAKNQTGSEYYPTVAEHLFRLAAELQSTGQMEISFLDLMGGLGIDYRHGEPVTPLDEMAQRIQTLYETIMEPSGLGDVPIYTELGRYLMAPCAILIASVTHVRHSFRDFIALDASAADLIRPMLYSGYHHISVVGKHETAGRRYYDVVGSMNNGSDNFGERRLLPETEPGDLCVIHDTGAHCAGSVFSHAGHFRCAEYLQTQSGQVVQIGAGVLPPPYFEPVF